MLLSKMPEPHLTPLQTTLLLLSLFITYHLLCTLFTALITLRSIPGPLIARFTSLYRPYLVSSGHAPDLYRSLHNKYGPIVRTAPKTLSISDPSTIPIIYGINTKYLKSSFYDVFTPIYKESLMPSMFSVRDPAQHQALRRPVAQKFSMSSIKSMEVLADECSAIFIDAMRRLSEKKEKVDLGEWLQWYAFDVIGAITFQKRFGFMEEGRDIEGMIGDIEIGLKYAGIVGQVDGLHGWLMGSRWLGWVVSMQPFVNVADPLRSVVKFTQECIDEYDRKPVEEHSHRPDFLSWLRGEETKGKPMSNHDMMNHLSNNLLAGSDTTGISLRAIIYFLVKSPAAYKKLQHEIDAADQAGKLSEYVTYAECLELEYLQAVMKEAMRCHPGVSFPLERVVPSGGATLCGTHIEAGTVVGINPAVIHHDTSIFGEDAAEFRPERWTDSSEERVKIMDRHLMMFGYGSRTCIGKNISIMEMGKLVPQLMRHFDIEWASDEAEWRIETFWFAKQHGLICRFIPRNNH